MEQKYGTSGFNSEVVDLTKLCPCETKLDPYNNYHVCHDLPIRKHSGHDSFMPLEKKIVPKQSKRREYSRQ